MFNAGQRIKALSKMGNKMNEGMLMPYNKMFAQMDAENKKA